MPKKLAKGPIRSTYSLKTNSLKNIQKKRWCQVIPQVMPLYSAVRAHPEPNLSCMSTKVAPGSVFWVSKFLPKWGKGILCQNIPKNRQITKKIGEIFANLDSVFFLVCEGFKKLFKQVLKSCCHLVLNPSGDASQCPNIRKLKKISLTPGQEPITNWELAHFQKWNELTEYFSEHLEIWKSGYLLASEWPLATWGTCWEQSGNLLGVQIGNNKHPTPHPPPKDKTSLGPLGCMLPHLIGCKKCFCLPVSFAIFGLGMNYVCTCSSDILEGTYSCWFLFVRGVRPQFLLKGAICLIDHQYFWNMGGTPPT
jgi:hypothetical protein